jgi:hypothetical protein
LSYSGNGKKPSPLGEDLSLNFDKGFKGPARQKNGGQDSRVQVKELLSLFHINFSIFSSSMSFFPLLSGRLSFGCLPTPSTGPLESWDP